MCTCMSGPSLLIESTDSMIIDVTVIFQCLIEFIITPIWALFAHKMTIIIMPKMGAIMKSVSSRCTSVRFFPKLYKSYADTSPDFH